MPVNPTTPIGSTKKTEEVLPQTEETKKEKKPKK